MLMVDRNYLWIISTVFVAVGLISAVLAINSPEDLEDNIAFVASEIPEIDIEEQGDYKTATFGVWCFWGPEARVGVVEGVIRTRVGYREVKGSTRDEEGIRREAMKVDYDPEKVSYMELYDIIYQTGQIRELHPFGEFVLTGRHHQKYHLGNHEEISKGYRELYPNLDDFINSTAAMRINGFLAGFGTLESSEELEGLGLTERGRQEVYDFWISRKR